MNFTTIKILSEELGIDKSNLRKYILGLGINPFSVRTSESRGQLTLALSEEEAQRVRDSRNKEGYIKDSTKPVYEKNGNGKFYVISIIPEFDHNRVKLGFANNIESRLQSHKTSAPTATLIKAWDCKRSWEETAMLSAIREGCKLVGGEVFSCDNLDELCARIDLFFEQMPPLDFKIERVDI